MSEVQSLDQRRARHAWEKLQEFTARHLVTGPKGNRLPDEAAKKYGVHVRKLPMRIMASGLGQALAFLLAKNYCPDLLSALGHWVLEKRRNPDSKTAIPAANALLNELIKRDSEFAQLGAIPKSAVEHRLA